MNDIILIVCLPIFYSTCFPHPSLILTLLLFAFFKAFANVAAVSCFKLSRLMPASILNLHFIHLLQLTNEYVKQELLFYYTN